MVNVPLAAVSGLLVLASLLSFVTVRRLDDVDERAGLPGNTSTAEGDRSVPSAHRVASDRTIPGSNDDE